MFIICKALGHSNYANGLAETLMQIEILPEKLSESLVWNRFCNNRGKSDSNMPIDLFMEHENKLFKKQLPTYRGEYTQASIDRISKSQTLINMILRNFDAERHGHRKSSKPTQPVSKDDVIRLVEVYKHANLFHEQPGRNHSTSLMFLQRNAMASLTSVEMEMWLMKKFKYLKGAHYYKQFVKNLNVAEELNLEDSLHLLSWSDSD